MGQGELSVQACAREGDGVVECEWSRDIANSFKLLVAMWCCSYLYVFGGQIDLGAHSDSMT